MLLKITAKRLFWYFALVSAAICFLIAIQNNWQDGYDDVRSLDVFYLYSDVEKWFGEYEIQLEAHQCYVWKTNFKSRYKNFDHVLNVIFNTKNGSTEQFGFTQSYENALNCIENNKQQDKEVELYFPSKISERIDNNEGTNSQIGYYPDRSCRWPDASGTYFIFLQAGEEGWRGSVAPYRIRAGSYGDGGYCILEQLLLCYFGSICLIPLLIILLLLRWCCRWRIPLVILLVVPMGILLSPCGVFVFRLNYYHMSL